MPKKKRPKFEDNIEAIDQEIRKRKNKWSLTALAWMDFDDVSQILRIHIYKKWDMYDPAQPLAPWINRIISNQIKNLIRNNYGNFTRPCLRCAAAEGTNHCQIYEDQNNACPLYAHWEKTKKRAHDAKLPLSLENHSREVHSISTDFFDVAQAAEKLHKKMKSILKANELQVYELLYIENLEEEEVASRMGYRTTEKNRQPGYKQIKNIKKSILIKVKKLLSKDEIDIF
jgi:RNA polymerase sigma factor (sigma-70 family)